MVDSAQIHPGNVLAGILFFISGVILGVNVAPALDPAQPAAIRQPVPRPAVAQPEEKRIPRQVKPAAAKQPEQKIRGERAEKLFHPIIVRVADKHDLDPALVKAIIKAESGYNPQAISKRGAMGLMQLMPGTAKAMGVTDAFDPERNIEGGVRYFKKLVNRFGGDVRLALAAYNAGAKNVHQYQGVPPFGATRYYIDKVFRYYDTYKKEMRASGERA